MAAPTYDTDLVDIDLAEAGSTGWTAFNISGGGGGAPAFGADFGMQGAGCWDKAASSAERAAAVNKTPGASAIASGVHIYQWGFVGTPGICDIYATRGVYVVVGTSTSNFMQYTVEGSDTIGAGGRVGKCYPVVYDITSNPSSIPYRTVNGSPGATPTYFGYGIKTIASAKSTNFGVDAVRYGTGIYVTDGEIADPITISGSSAENDLVDNRWGVLTNIGGTYELQGKYVIGQNISYTPTQAFFNDSNININIVDTPHTSASFSQIIIDHAQTTASFNNVNLTAFGTNNPGKVVVAVANPQFDVTGSSWTNIGTTQLRSNTTIIGTTWRGTDTVFQSGSSIDGATFASLTSTSSLISDNPGLISNCSFESDGSNHGVEITETGTFTFDGNDFTGYEPADGSTGNEAVYNNSGGIVSMSLANASTPSVRNGSGASTKILNDTSITLTGMKDLSEVQIVLTDTITPAGAPSRVEDATDGSTDDRSFTFSAAAGIIVDIKIISVTYENERIEGYEIPGTNTSIPIQQSFDRNKI